MHEAADGPRFGEATCAAQDISWPVCTRSRSARPARRNAQDGRHAGDRLDAGAAPPERRGAVRHRHGAAQRAALRQLRFDADWKPQPYLAESWELSPDARALTLHLRKDALFHDGKPVTSEDVAFSVMAVKQNHPFQTMLAPVDNVETPDPHTAVLRMSRPHPAILLAMSPALMPVLPTSTAMART